MHPDWHSAGEMTQLCPVSISLGARELILSEFPVHNLCSVAAVLRKLLCLKEVYADFWTVPKNVRGLWADLEQDDGIFHASWERWTSGRVPAPFFVRWGQGSILPFFNSLVSLREWSILAVRLSNCTIKQFRWRIQVRRGREFIIVVNAFS